MVHRCAPDAQPDLAGRAPDEPAVSAPTSLTAPPPGRLRILVVDDDEPVCTTLTVLLEFQGHAVATASTAVEALELADHKRFDLVITDYSMSGMNGADLAAALHAYGDSCPVILITAYAQTLPRTLPYVDRIVGKPFTQHDLSDAVANVIAARVPGSPPSASGESGSSV